MGVRSKAIFDFTYMVHRVDDHGNIIETLAKADNFDIARAAFTAALQCRSWATLELREKSRIVSVAKTGGYDSGTRSIELLSIA